MKSIRWKLVIMYVALIFIVLILAGTFIILSVKSGEENKAEIELRQYAARIMDFTIYERENPEDFQEDFQSVSSSGFNRLQGAILNADGITLASSEYSEETGFPQYASSAIVSAALGADSFVAGRKLPDVNSDVVSTWVEYACPVFGDNGDVLYIIYVRLDATSVYESISETTNTLAVAIFLALALTAVFAVIFSGTLTEPISKLTAGARELARGKLDQSLKINSKDEIGQLTESFNNMAKALKKTISEMDAEKNKLEIVLYSMSDGLLAFDAEGRLIHANQVCEELLGVKDAKSLDFAGFIKLAYPGREPGEELTPVRDFKDTTLSIDGRFINVEFNAYASSAGDFDGVVVVLQDITKHKKLDDMRKEFIANVSHEIRTPLTNIKSYAETLLEGALDDKAVAADFLGIIDSEVDRMTFIIKDLTELSSMDNHQLYLDLESVDISAIIKDVIKQHSMTARKLGREIIFEESKSPEGLFLTVDRRRVAQVLTNILTNAIKYSFEGSRIELWTEDSRQYTRVYVRDNGMGIPKEDLRHIFERFYRVDKARSRAFGGTGLGLAIAKEIMEAHGGGISAVSEPGKGTTMIIRFPKKDEDEFE